MNMPSITITRVDLERLERLLNSARMQAIPGTSMLERELIRADVVEPEDIAPDVVTMKSTVRFADEQARTEYKLALVYPGQAGTAGTVSVFAPVGSALLGLSDGQTIRWQVPGGRDLLLRVIAVTYQPESHQCDDLHALTVVS